MKKELCNGLCELTDDEMMEIDGGGWLDTIYNFFLGRLIWSPALYSINNNIKNKNVISQ